MSKDTFTGITRRRQTRRSVKVIDRLARVSITLGGIGTIVAVSGIMVFLVWVVLPLFGGGSFKNVKSWPARGKEGRPRPVRVVTDEYRAITAILSSDGSLLTRSARDGALLAQEQPFSGATPTCQAFDAKSGKLVFGFADGTIRIGSLTFQTSYLEKQALQQRKALPPGLLSMRPGDALPFAGGVVQMTPEHQYRLQKLSTTFEKPAALEPGVPVVRVDVTSQDEDSIVVALTANGTVDVERVRKRTNLMTGETEVRLVGSEVPIHVPEGRDLPDHLLLSGIGNDLYVIWKDGNLVRMNIRDPENPVEAEVIDLLPEDGARITALSWMTGKTSILVGDSLGRVSVWFPTKPEAAQTVDGIQIVRAHRFPRPGAPVTAVQPSSRTRMFAVGYADGHLRLYHVTTENLVAEAEVAPGEPVLAVSVTPKEDAVCAGTASRLWVADLFAPHPDISLGAMFTKVWYEGYPAPDHVWQSTGGTDEFEPKFGLVKLVFGTLKATLYSMLFGLPLALLGAIFASEFLHPRVKSKLKPTIEIMASLPSVVLGFLGGLVIAPFVEGSVAVVLATFLSIPFTFLLGAYLWQLLPQELSLRLSRFRFPIICALLPAGIGLALVMGPLLESSLFAGDLRSWLDGRIGRAFGGWFYLFLPVSAVLVAILLSRFLGPAFRRVTADWDRQRVAALDLARFLAATLLTLLLASLLAEGLDLAGLDPRGSLVGTYVQRNALVVGFVMGFAIIPIIFTIADDALSAVPEHLRSASLGAGATRWQTATRVIIPTAMSGLFSAAMIGLGRAVGETMIVLMAAGNTPVMDLNIFNGFRTLSANLAVELPEAVQNSTHYRTLFFAALVLFAMTFVLNTVAEAVRQRFRKRAFEL